MKKSNVAIIILALVVLALAATLVLVLKKPQQEHIHEVAIDVAVAPTCTETGLTEGKHCSVCGEVLLKQETVAANGHNMADGVCCVCGYGEGDLEYILSSDQKGYYVSGIGTYKGTKVVIPSEYRGWPVTGISDSAFYECTSLKSITIPDGVTSIGRHAFGGCSSLESITVESGNTKYHSAGNCIVETANKKLVVGCKSSVIPADGSVTSIGKDAFYGCTSLKSIAIPDSVTSIDDYAFEDCTNLTSVAFGENSKLMSIGFQALYRCTSLTSITIPDSVTSIGNYAFSYCMSLTSVTIPDSVTSIGNDAFSGCTSLTSVHVTGLAKWCEISFGSYGANPLYYAHNLYLDGHLITNLIIPDSVTSICVGAFYNCTSLTSTTIPDSVTSIGNSAFNGCTSLASITIPNSVTSIGDSVFDGCTNLTSITIPDSVTSIGDDAFSGCKSLTSITIPDSVTNIGGFAFSYCTSLTSVTFGKNNKLTSISGSAFYGCTSLKNITIPDGMTSIGYRAFYDCTSLVIITIPDSVTSIGKEAFYNTAYYNNKANWTDGVLYIGNHLIQANSYKLAANYTIKSGTKCIADSAFYNCKSLVIITIPDSVTGIGENAFYNTAYYNYEFNWTYGVLYIGNHLIKANSGKLASTCAIKSGTKCIANSAFSDCSNLKSITIPDSVTSIGSGAFSGCSSLTNITIPDGVTGIGNSVFNSCSSLTSITIPDSVTSIGESAFRNCCRLETIVFEGTEAQWNAITKGTYWHWRAGDNTSAKKYILVFEK